MVIKIFLLICVVALTTARPQRGGQFSPTTFFNPTSNKPTSNNPTSNNPTYMSNSSSGENSDCYSTFFDTATYDDMDDEQSNLAFGDLLMTLFMTAAGGNTNMGIGSGWNQGSNSGNWGQGTNSGNWGQGTNSGGPFNNRGNGNRNQGINPGGIFYNNVSPYMGYGLGNFAFPQFLSQQGRGFGNFGYGSQQGGFQNTNFRQNYGNNYDYYGFGSGVMYNQPARGFGSSFSTNFRPNAPFYWIFA